MSQQPAGPEPVPPHSSVGAGSAGQSVPGAARALALVAAGLGLLIYLLGYVGEVSVTSSFGGPLLLGGGLLAGTAALPRTGRVLAPAAVLVVTGALLLLQLVTGIGGRPVLVVASLLALLEAAAVVGALLLASGVLARRDPLSPGYPGYPSGSAAGLGSSGFRPSGYGPPGVPGSYPGPATAAIGAAPPGGPEVPGGGAVDGPAPGPLDAGRDPAGRDPAGSVPPAVPGGSVPPPAPGGVEPVSPFAPPRPPDAPRSRSGEGESEQPGSTAP
jgi:Family of unknown function (DUF5336)